MRPADTSPEAWKVWLDLMRRMPPEEKLQRAFQYSSMVREMAESTLRRRYPRANDREIFLRAARQRLGAEIFEKVYGGEFAA